MQRHCRRCMPVCWSSCELYLLSWVALLLLIQTNWPCCISAFSVTDCRYSQTEKEALMTTWACERLSTYFVGLLFTAETDPLVPLLGTKALDKLPPQNFCSGKPSGLFSWLWFSGCRLKSIEYLVNMHNGLIYENFVTCFDLRAFQSFTCVVCFNEISE